MDEVQLFADEVGVVVHRTASGAYQMMVVSGTPRSFHQLESCPAVTEIELADQTQVGQLIQRAIHCCEADSWFGVAYSQVNILRAEVAFVS